MRTAHADGRPAHLGAGPARREPRISIGQVDVQVINHPLVTAPQHPAASGDRSSRTTEADRLEIERFGWRLS
jgi:hypothetical protein